MPRLSNCRWIVAARIAVWVVVPIVAHGSDILDLAEEAFARTPSLAARKAAEARGRIGDMVESIVSVTGVGGDEAGQAGTLTATERIRRAALTSGTHRGADGTLIDVSPDGVVRFTTPDERMAIILPNGRRFYRASRHSTVIDVDGVDDRLSFAPGKPPPAPPGKQAAGAEEGLNAFRDGLLAIDRQIEERMDAWQASAARGDAAAVMAARNDIEVLEQSIRTMARNRQQSLFPPGDDAVAREQFLGSLDEIQNGIDEAIEQWRQATHDGDGAAATAARRRIDELRESRNNLYAGRDEQARPVLWPRPNAEEESAAPHDEPAVPVAEAHQPESPPADESDVRPIRRQRDDQVEYDRETRRHIDPGGSIAEDRRRHSAGEPGSHADFFGRLDAALGTPPGQSPVEAWDHLSSASGSAAEDDLRIVVREDARPTYRPPQSGDDAVISASRIPGSGVEVFVRESGARQMRLPDGTVVTTYPGLENVNVTDASGQSTWIDRQDDGLVTTSVGGIEVAIEPDSGRTFVMDRNADGAGGRIVVEGNGAYAFTDSDASFQARRPDNALDNAGYIDAATGATVRYDADTGTTRLYTPEGVLGGVRNDVTGVFVNPATGGQLPVDGLLRPPAATGNPAAVSVWTTSQSELPAQGPRAFPSSAELAAQYIAAAREMIARATEDIRLQGVPQEEIDRIRRDLGTMETEVLVQRDLERLRRIAESRAGGFVAPGDDTALAAIDSQIAAAEAALEAARSEARRRRDELSTARAEASAAIREANETVSRGERNLELFVTTNDPALQKAELAALEPRVKDGLEAAARAARSMIDYSQFRCSPAGAPWDKCEHEDEKQRWLAAQMAAALKRAMGPALEAQARRVEELKNTIADKEKAIERERKLQQAVQEQAERVLQHQKEKEKQLADQLKAAEKAADEDIRAKDEALFNLKQKRIEVALRPKPRASDLREFVEAMGVAFDD